MFFDSCTCVVHAQSRIAVVVSEGSEKSTETPYIGCRISLISKCGNRYDGILFSVDADEATIAFLNGGSSSNRLSVGFSAFVWNGESTVAEAGAVSKRRLRVHQFQGQPLLSTPSPRFVFVRSSCVVKRGACVFVAAVRDRRKRLVSAADRIRTHLQYGPSSRYRSAKPSH